MKHSALSSAGVLVVSLLHFAGFTALAGATQTTTSLAVTSAGAAVTTVTSGSVITLTATVQAGGAGVTPGTVSFCDANATYCTDIHQLGVAQLTGSGTATIRLTPAIGRHSYYAVFAGTSSFPGSRSSAADVSVSGTPPTVTTLSTGGSAGNYSLYAASSGVGIAAPSGSVSFQDHSNGNAVIGSATLSAAVNRLNFVDTYNAGPISSAQVIAGDYNGDGVPDFAVIGTNPTSGANSVSIQIGNGDGTFTSGESTIGIGSGKRIGGIAQGDFNNDGKLDLAVSSYDLQDFNPSAMDIFFGKGDGTFYQASSLTLAAGSVGPIGVGDFNSDGILDLMVVTGGGPVLLFGNGDGSFTPSVSTIQGFGYGIAVGDFNQDGKLDIALCNEAGVEILLGNGDGTFSAPAFITGDGYGGLFIATDDFNGDGKLDLAATNYYNGVTVFLGNGDGTFTANAITNLPNPAPGGITVGDFNGDGVLDLAVSDSGNGNYFLGSVSILLGTGNGTFSGEETTFYNTGPGSLASADFNGDGFTDLAVVVS